MEPTKLYIYFTVITGLLNVTWIGIFSHFFFLKILDFDQSTVKPVPITCNNTCSVRLAQNMSLAAQFKSFKMDDSSALFAHFHVRNSQDDSLEPFQDLLWVTSNKAPFTSLDLGYNVYSFGFLSSKVHMMRVLIEGDNNRRCLLSTNNSICATKVLSKAFLQQVTDGKGTLCYMQSDLKYQCCEMNSDDSAQIDCNIPAVMTNEMKAIFIVIAVIMFLAMLCFPYLSIYIPNTYNPKFEPLGNNSQIFINPFYRCLKKMFQGIRSQTWAIFVRCLVIGFLVISLSILSASLNWYIMKYEIPRMFYHDTAVIQQKWYARTLSDPKLFIPLTVLPFFAGVAALCYLLTDSRHHGETYGLATALRDYKIDWREPISFINRQICNDENSNEMGVQCYCDCLILKFRWLTKVTMYILGLVIYLFYITPINQTLMYFHKHRVHLSAANKRCHQKMFIVSYYMFSVSMPIIVMHSLLLIARIIVYFYSGIVVNTDNIVPKLALAGVFMYYIGSYIVSVKEEYENLLVKTFEECKKQFAEHLKQKTDRNNQLLQLMRRSTEECKQQLQLLRDSRNERRNCGELYLQYLDAAYEQCNRQEVLMQIITEEPPQESQINCRDNFLFHYDTNDVPYLSTKLSEEVIDKILPISGTYTKVCMKATCVLLFGLLIYYGIVIFGPLSKLGEVTQAIAVIFGTLLPKLFPMFFSNSSTNTSSVAETVSRQIETIVGEFINENRNTTTSNNNNNSQLYGSTDNEPLMEQTLPNTSGTDQPNETTDDDIVVVVQKDGPAVIN